MAHDRFFCSLTPVHSSRIFHGCIKMGSINSKTCHLHALYNIIRRIASHWMRLLPKYHQQRHSYFWMPFEISHPLNKGPLQWKLRLSSVIHAHAPMVMCLSGGRQVLSNMSYHHGCLFRLMQLTSRCVLVLPTKGLGVGINYLDNVRILT